MMRVYVALVLRLKLKLWENLNWYLQIYDLVSILDCLQKNIRLYHERKKYLIFLKICYFFRLYFIIVKDCYKFKKIRLAWGLDVLFIRCFTYQMSVRPVPRLLQTRVSCRGAVPVRRRATYTHWSCLLAQRVLLPLPPADRSHWWKKGH
jgi:hypothetical protein